MKVNILFQQYHGVLFFKKKIKTTLFLEEFNSWRKIIGDKI